MRKILFLVTFILFLVSCENDPKIIGLKPISTENTVFVYMAADNSLSNFATENIKSMKNGLMRNTVEGNLVIYIDQGQSPKLILLEKSYNGEVTEKVIKEYPNQNSVSPTVMANVLMDMEQSFPTKNYGLILWSHGYGWFPGERNTKSVTTRWFGVDGNNFMDLPDLVTALKNGPHFNYILFDACFMGGIETSYALRSCTDYLITSPAEVLSDGFPYEKILPYLFGKTESEYIAVASTFYEHYNALFGTDRSASIACIKTSELEQLAVETRKLYAKHILELNAHILTNSVQYLECYDPHLFYDFGHLVQGFTTVLERAAFEVQMEKVLVYKACTPTITSVRNSGYWEQVAIKNFSGLNCFIPQRATPSYNIAYRVNEWYQASGLNLTDW